LTRLLLDLNVVLDVLVKRDPHAPSSGAVLRLAEHGVVDGFLCASAVDTLEFLLRKGGLTPKVARRHLRTLRQFLGIANVTAEVVDAALAAEWPDFEDAVVHESARLSGLDGIVSRDRDGFARASLPVYRPEEVLGAIRSES